MERYKNDHTGDGTSERAIQNGNEMELSINNQTKG